jgi:hypothetical protein
MIQCRWVSCLFPYCRVIFCGFVFVVKGVFGYDTIVYSVVFDPTDKEIIEEARYVLGGVYCGKEFVSDKIEKVLGKGGVMFLVEYVGIFWHVF